MHNLDSFDGRATDFRSWLFRIATNAVNDHLRSAKRRADVAEKAVINTRGKGDLREWQKTGFLKGMELYEML
jgi:DNA-directed RNA polymerase specialized sigma24 family protein